MADALASMSAGLFQVLGLALVRLPNVLTVVPYQYIRQHHSLGTWTTSGAVSTAVAFLGVDFLYYVFHRKAHEINILWAGHVAHHNGCGFTGSILPEFV